MDLLTRCPAASQVLSACSPSRSHVSNLPAHSPAAQGARTRAHVSSRSGGAVGSKQMRSSRSAGCEALAGGSHRLRLGGGASKLLGGYGGRRRGPPCPRKRAAPSLRVAAAMAPNDGVRWWEKDAPENMRDIHSTQEFVEALSSADEALVVVEFYASWCGSCRALYPKLCKIAGERPDVKFYKVNFEENKPMCKTLNIKVLPYFHFYRGADGRLDAFSASISKLARLKEAIEVHSTDRCSLGPVAGASELLQDQAATADAR